MNKSSSVYLLLLVLVFLTGCQANYETIQPTITYIPQQQQIGSLPSPFAPLSDEEREEDWGKELRIALTFGYEMDLYRSITSFKRALFLLPPELKERRQQIEYEIVLCYYLGLKYHETVHAFETSSLTSARSTFPAYRTLLIILYDAYVGSCIEDKAKGVLELIQKHDEGLATDLRLFSAFEEGELSTIQEISETHRSKENLEQMMNEYDSQKLSPPRAQTLNALLPGAGYYYVGQKRSAITSFLMNSLFIWATVYFFEEGNIAAGILSAGFEAGWYLGGINGAGLTAKQYNENLYACIAKETMLQERLFPVLMFNYAF